MTYQAIHDGLIESMTHMQGAGYIRRWQLNRKVPLALIHGGVGDTSTFPLWTPVGLYRGGFIGFGELVR